MFSTPTLTLMPKVSPEIKYVPTPADLHPNLDVRAQITLAPQLPVQHKSIDELGQSCRNCGQHENQHKYITSTVGMGYKDNVRFGPRCPTGGAHFSPRPPTILQYRDPRELVMIPDINRMVQLFAQRGCLLPREVARQAWQTHSERTANTFWLSLPQADDDIFTILNNFLTAA